MANNKAKKSQKKKPSKPTPKNGKNGKKAKSPLKRSTVGFEVEFFILDKNGRMVNKADNLLKKIEEKNRACIPDVTKEISKNIIEVGSYPEIESVNTLKALLDNLKILLYTADEEDLMICPLGTYPGKFTPKMRTDYHYRDYNAVFGQKHVKMGGQCVGYHFHYALPWGVFDYKKKNLKRLINSKNKQSLVNAYIFLIAADPALTAFMQSSPFYQGKYVAKDTRMLVWRGGKDLDNTFGWFANHPELGGLPSYEHTGTDIINLTAKRKQDWFSYVKKAGIKEPSKLKHGSDLDYNWSPVKINAHGTIEQRGMDINHLLVILSVSKIIKTVLRAIQEDYIKVECSDIAVKEPFKYDKKTIYIPPDTHVKQQLQKLSAYKGFDNDEVYYYAKRLFYLAKILGGKKVEPFIEPLEKMIKDKKTLSDEIIKEARKLGYEHTSKKNMPADVAAAIAVNHSRRLFKEIVLAQKFIE